MLIALVGFNANAAMYIVGQTPFGNWNPGGGVEMTNNGDGTYTYTATINGTVYFVFGDGQNSDWTTFNNDHRYGPANGNEAVTAGVWKTTQKAGDHGAYYFQGSGEDYVFTFDETNHQFKVEGYVEPVVFENFTVAGNNADIFGEEWNPALTANDMTLDETDGLYKLVKNGVAISAAYSLEYKVVANHSWDNNWGKTPGGDNQDYYFEQAGTYNLTFKFDLANEAVTLDAEKVEDGPVVDDYYIVAGTENLFGTNWSATDTLNLMTEGEEGMFTWTKAGFEATAGTEVQFKVVANSNWNTCWPQSDENGDNNWWYQFAEDGVYTVVITFNEETKEINLTATKTGDLPEPPQPTVDDVYIFGDVNNYAWDPTQGVKMTYNESTYTAEVTTTMRENEAKAYIGFTKMLADSTSETPWDDIAAYRFGPESDGAFVMTEELLGVDCNLATDGSYNSIALPEGTWTVTVDLVNNKFNVNGTWPTDTVVPEPITVYTVVGPEAIFGTDWNETDENNDMTLVEGVYTWTKENVELAAGSFGFKVVGNHSWDNEWPMGYGNNWIKYVEEAGIYTINITYDPEAADSAKITCEITKTGTIEPEHYTGDVYILGEVNDNGGWFTNVGVLMTRNEENNIYTATITTAGENIPEGEETGYSYFSFTKQLADSAADWDAIAPYRFGAVSEGDYWVTEEVLGTEIPLQNGGQSFRVPAGKWNLTLSVDNMTLVIAKAESVMRGDLNGDGQINTGDLSALIAALLNSNTDSLVVAADPSMDGQINTGDISALISYLLNGTW